MINRTSTIDKRRIVRYLGSKPITWDSLNYERRCGQIIGKDMLYICFLQVGASNISALRFVFQTLPVIPLVFIRSEDLFRTTKTEWLLIVACSLLIGAGALVAYSALVYIPVMDATVLFNAQPIWVLFLSPIFLKTRIGVLDIITTGIVIIGVVFICQPTFLFGIATTSSESWKGYLMGISSIILAGTSNCIVRKLRNKSISVILIMQTVTLLPLFLLYDLVTKDDNDPQTTSVWVDLILAVFFSSIARILATAALKYEEAHVVSVIMSLEIVLSMPFQVLMFGIHPNALGYTGAMFVMFGIIVISLRSKIEDFFKSCAIRCGKSRKAAKEKEECQNLIVD